MSSVIQRIESIVRNNRVAAFTKSHCPHSEAAKSSLSSAGVKFHAEDIDKWDEKDMNAAQDHFLSTTGARSVPRIFIDGKCIGGNSDFQAAYVETAIDEIELMYDITDGWFEGSMDIAPRDNSQTKQTDCMQSLTPAKDFKKAREIFF